MKNTMKSCLKLRLSTVWVESGRTGHYSPVGMVTTLLRYGSLQNTHGMQHSIAILEQCCKHSKQCRDNIVTLWFAKNRRCKSSRVTLGSISAVSRVRSWSSPSGGWVRAHFPEQRLLIEPSVTSSWNRRARNFNLSSKKKNHPFCFQQVVQLFLDSFFFYEVSPLLFLSPTSFFSLTRTPK